MINKPLKLGWVFGITLAFLLGQWGEVVLLPNALSVGLAYADDDRSRGKNQLKKQIKKIKNSGMRRD